MPVESLRWETLDALKNSSKGKLKYNTEWPEKGEDILAGYTEVPSLSPLSGYIFKRLSPRAHQSSKACSLGGGYAGLGGGYVSPDSSPCEEIPSSSPLSLSPVPSSPTTTTTPPPNTAGLSSTPLGALTSKTDTEQVVADDGRSGPGEGLSPVSSRSPTPTISLVSPRATQTAGCIRICEEKHRAKAKMELNLRQEMQERLVASVANRESEQLKRFEELMELKQRQEHQSMMDMMNRETKESIGRHEKLKEEQRHRMKILNLRLREAEQQRVREAESERQRQTEGRERLRNLNTIQEEVLQLNQLLEPAAQAKTGPAPPDLPAYITRGNQLCSQVSEVVRTTNEGEFPSVEDMAVAERALHEMRALIRLMQEETAKAQERKAKEHQEHEAQQKQAELQAQQEEQRKKAAVIAKEKAQRKGLQTKAEEGTLKWYRDLQAIATRSATLFEDLNNPKDMQSKKLRLELQKAATIPVSQISSTSGSLLKDIFDKIDKLLCGRSVVSAGKTVSTSQHPKGLEYVSYKLAEKFVKQGEEEVASHHEAAFPIAAVATGVWEKHPNVGDLILAHLHKKCPYAVPHYPPMKDGTSVEDYQRVLGYRVDDNGVEGQDAFLKRMSGMIRLYAAIIQQRWPYGSKQGPDPHGLNHGWRWLAQMLNMEPLADITATLLFDFLEVCGHALMKQYQGQFLKLMLFIKEEYLQRIEAVTGTGQMGSVIRLKEFLETSLRSRQIVQPKGQLSSHFWRS